MSAVRKIFSICALCFLLSSFSPDAWNTMTQEEFGNYFKQQEKIYNEMVSYSVNVKHASYETYTSTVANDRSEGYFRKSGNSYHSSMVGMQIIQNSKIKLVIDTAGKHIMIASPDKSFEYMNTEQFQQSLEGCNAIKYRTVDEGKLFRIEYKESSTFSIAEYMTDKKSIVQKITLYYKEFETQERWDEQSQKIKPRIEITYSDFKTNVSFDKNEFDEKKYIRLNGEKYAGTGDFKNYKIFDTRIPKQ